MSIESAKYSLMKCYSVNDRIDRNCGIYLKLNDTEAGRNAFVLQVKTNELAKILVEKYTNLPLPSQSVLDNIKNNLLSNTIEFTIRSLVGGYSFTFNANKLVLGDNLLFLIYPFTTNTSVIDYVKESKCFFADFTFNYTGSFLAGLNTGSYKLLETDTFNIWRTIAPKDISRVEYKNKYSSFDFQYDESIWTGVSSLSKGMQVAYLRCRIDYPTFNNKQEIYRKSNGEFVKVSANNEKEWKLITDFADADFHEALSVGLLHEYFTIDGKRLQQNGTYETKWNEEANFINQTKGETKVIETPFDTEKPNFSSFL